MEYESGEIAHLQPSNGVSKKGVSEVVTRDF